VTFMSRNKRKQKPVCPYCKRNAVLVTGKVIYPHRRDLHAKSFWNCFNCKAYVGCHPKSDVPLGRLSDIGLRDWKSKAHAEFDPVWKEGWMTRSEAYRRLAIAMDIPLSKCHIGEFDADQCRLVVRVARTLIDG
jgi:hypothetical protein